MTRRPVHTRQPAPAPPTNAEDGAARVRSALIGLFDRTDGTGADWRLMLESVYRAAFKIADELPADVRLSLMRRVHAGAEVRITGGYGDELGTVAPDRAGPAAGGHDVGGLPTPSNMPGS